MKMRTRPASPTRRLNSIPVMVRTSAGAILVAMATSLISSEAVALQTRGVHEHDGFYLRLGLGAGLLGGKLKPEDGGEMDVTGIGVASNLLVGGTIAPGLVLGAGSSSIYVPSPQLKMGSAEDDGQPLVQSGIGPFLDYYWDPHGGAHVGGALMLAVTQVREDSDKAGASGPGFGAMVMGGYDWWVGEQWSLGVLGSLAYYSTKLTADAPGDPKLDFAGIIPAVLFTATYH